MNVDEALKLLEYMSRGLVIESSYSESTDNAKIDEAVAVLREALNKETHERG